MMTNLTGLPPLPEAEGLPIGLRVLIDDVQQLCRLGQVAVYLGLQAIRSLVEHGVAKT